MWLLFYHHVRITQGLAYNKLYLIVKFSAYEPLHMLIYFMLFSD